MAAARESPQGGKEAARAFFATMLATCAFEE